MNSLVLTACVLLLTLASALTPPRAAAQDGGGWDPARMQLSRPALEELLARFEQTAESEAHSPEFRARARYEAALIRTRLREGDFQIGDQITLAVEGEQALSGLFVVNPQRGLTLPVIGELPLQGVLRSELQSHVSTHLERFIREPVLRVRSSIRVLVSGEVAEPGYLVVDTESLLSDVLMLAGGPSPRAQLTQIRVERANARIWEGMALQQAIAEGRTMDQLSLRAGDHIIVPAEGSGRMGLVSRMLLTGLPAVTLLITTLTSVF